MRPESDAARRFGRPKPGRPKLGRPGLARQNRATIAVLGALLIALLVGMGGFVIDLGTAYLVRLSAQRTADGAAYAGGLAYNASGSTATMQSAAGNLAVLNGLASTGAVASLVSSPSGDGKNAVAVTVTQAATVWLSRVFQSATSVTVTATSYAEVTPAAMACVIALQSGGAGIALSSGATLTASGCTVASDSTVSVPCGSTITTKTLDYNSGSAPSQPCSGIVPPSGTASVSIVKQSTANPLSGNAALAAAFSHLTAVGSESGPSGPSVSTGTDIAFGTSASNTALLLSAAGCTGGLSGTTWTVTCPASGTYHFGSFTIASNVTLNFATSGSTAATVYDFSGQISHSGAAANFGTGTYNIAGGVYTSSGSTSMTFAAGTFDIGAGGCNYEASYSLCNYGPSLTFGAGAFTLAGGIYNASGKVTLGSGGSSNSYSIGPATGTYGGDSFNMGGGSTTILNNTASGTFLAAGAIENEGTSLVLPAAPAHDIKGAITTTGSITFGAGTYTVAGAFSATGGGGTLTGSGVSFVLSGAFSVGAGFDTITLTAPTSGTLQGLLAASNGSGGASFTSGADNTSLSGIFYVPGGPITLGGGAKVGDGSGQCLEFIGTTLSLSGGTALGASCSGLGGSAGGTVALVQ